MTSIQSPSARAFQTSISTATTKAEVTSALSTLEQAKDLSPSEKVALAKAAFDDVSTKPMGFGVDTAFKGFIEGQGSPVGPKASPTMARIGAVLANSAQSLEGAMNAMGRVASRGKGGGVAAGPSPAELAPLLKKIGVEVNTAGASLASLAGDIAKGRGDNITAGDVGMVSAKVSDAQAGIKDLLAAISSAGTVSKGDLSAVVKDLLRASSLASNTKEVGQVHLAAVATEAVTVGKRGGVHQPSPFAPEPIQQRTFGSLNPNSTVLSRVTDQQLQFAESKISAWHDTSAVSDNDVRLVRQTLGELFQLPRGQYLTLEKASGDSAIFGGHLIKGEVRDAGGTVTSRFSGDLNTGNLDLQTVRVGK